MKNAIIILCILALTSCTKNKEIKTGKCYDMIPEGTTCQAYWESWLYDDATKTCVKKGYSGCSPVGCETEQECKDCIGSESK